MPHPIFRIDFVRYFVHSIVAMKYYLTEKEFLKAVCDYIAETGIAETKFSINAVGYRTFVHDLKKGVSPSVDKAARVMKFMADNPPPAAAQQDDAA